MKSPCEILPSHKRDKCEKFITRSKETIPEALVTGALSIIPSVITGLVLASLLNSSRNDK